MRVQMLDEVPMLPGPGLGPYRDADYQALPDEPRCELLYGELVVTPAPASRHQVVVRELLHLLREHERAHGGLVLVSPVDVRLFDHSVVQPDLVYVAPERLSIVRRRFEGTPDLVVEVLSAGSGRRDRVWKLNLYAEAGVREYWIVDPETQTIEFLVLHGARFEVQRAAWLYGSPAISSLELDQRAFWEEVRAVLAKLPE